ncbi:cholesterol transport system auxiliary component [Azomonas agilis]|uniref:Cholesterol transport system auxiliary component n=1 Tax=Azomonas agilis TaxID=116849 RepID=A0A562I1S5_9GAMM|nr:ABC-type transport auxiliary lipoprotein family protein [Azomonas agilis]TWH64625.1 cholesterol transport system auxiliary component [Azomonas agilis]
MTRVLCLLLLGVSLSACSVLPESEPLKVYMLPDAKLPSSSAAAVSWSLRINQPQTSQALNSARIAVLPTPNQLSNYAGARWSSPAPFLLRQQLQDAFLRDGRIMALSNDDSQLQADRVLDGDLRAFQVEYSGGRPEAVIRLDLRLVDNTDQRILANRRFEVRQALSQDQVEGAVSALGSAAGKLATEVVGWTLSYGG